MDHKHLSPNTQVGLKMLNERMREIEHTFRAQQLSEKNGSENRVSRKAKWIIIICLIVVLGVAAHPIMTHVWAQQLKAPTTQNSDQGLTLESVNTSDESQSQFTIPSNLYQYSCSSGTGRGIAKVPSVC
jgi:hypothetical protein